MEDWDQHPGRDRDGVVEESTGHPAVDAVLSTLGPLSDLPVSQHPAVYEAAHTALRAALSDAQQPRPS